MYPWYRESVGQFCGGGSPMPATIKTENGYNDCMLTALDYATQSKMTLLEKKSDLLDTKVPLLTRIKFPRVWQRLDGGIRVEDLQEDRFDEALDHIKKFYIPDETLCRISKLSEDFESIENYLKLIWWWMRDTQSLVAIVEETGKIIGVLVGRVHDSYLMKTLSRVMDYNGEPLKKMQKFSMYITKAVDIKNIFDVEEYNQIYVWSVDINYRNKGIGKGLLQACIEQTKSFKLKILVGIFTNEKSQSLAKHEGFYTLFELSYNNWKTRTPVVFKDNTMKNCSAKLMVLNLENTQYGNKYEGIMEKYNMTKFFLSRSTIKRKLLTDKDEKDYITLNT